MRIGEDAFNVYVNVTRVGDYLFVSDEEPSGSIVVIDLRRARENDFSEDAIIGRVPTGRQPVGLVFSPDRKLLYSTSAIAAGERGWSLKCEPEAGAKQIPEGAIVIVDVEKAKHDSSGAVLGRVPAGCMPVRLDITPDGSSLWTTVRKDDAIAG
jgi:DNA-binding beta-propeller fold protein YncE